VLCFGRSCLEFCVSFAIEMIRLSIIGNSGNKLPLSVNAWKFAKCAVQLKIAEILKREGKMRSDIQLQSGGSSGIDHLTLLLFNESFEEKEGSFKACHLYLPSAFQFDDSGGALGFSTTNPYSIAAAATLNRLHGEFSTLVLGYNSYDDFIKAKTNGMTCTIGCGFFARNRMLAAQTDICIALTFGTGAEPKDGGTRYTWSMLAQHALKIHISLQRDHQPSLQNHKN